MGNKQNIIEINGKKYDAVTGAQITSLPHSAASSHVSMQPAVKRPTMDGVMRPPKKTAAVRPSFASSIKAPQTTPQKSKTLMRAAVKKPHNILAHTAVHAPKATTNHVSGKAVITPRAQAAPPHRTQLASTVQKSTMVHKFGPASPSAAANPTVVPMPVAPPPADTSSTLKHNRITSKTSDLLEKALEAAKGHNEPYYQHKQSLKTRISRKLGISGRATAIGTAVVAGLLLGGFYAYQNVPNLAMRVAATRAGFSAGMPGYSPSGFAFSGPVQYSAGQVIVGFRSNTDDREYRITQQSTNWSSDSLLNNFVIASGKQYQTYQDRGRTIYIYDGSSATWVNGGVWYQIDGKSNLTSDQLVKIATSL